MSGNAADWVPRLQTESEATAEAVAAWEGRLRQSMDAIRSATVVASVNMDALIALAQLGRAEHDRQDHRIDELEALLDGDARKLASASGAQYAASAARVAELEAKVVEWEGAYKSLDNAKAMLISYNWKLATQLSDAERDTKRLACPDCGKHISPLGGER